LISDERKEKAMRYLAETDLECAELEGEQVRREYLLDMIKDRVFLTADGSSIREREARSNTSAEVQRAHEEYVQALVRFKHMKSKRQTETMICDQWRSENANRRQGQ
jgi:hypothetical protein